MSNHNRIFIFFKKRDILLDEILVKWILFLFLLNQTNNRQNTI